MVRKMKEQDLKDRQEWIDDISDELTNSVPPERGVREDLKRNFRVVLEAALARLELVTREEFDVQRAVLTRLRAELAALEQQVGALEQQRRD